jgi:hypothetical protein
MVNYLNGLGIAEAHWARTRVLHWIGLITYSFSFDVAIGRPQIGRSTSSSCPESRVSSGAKWSLDSNGCYV